MLSTNSQHLSEKWTWADLVSSYRFWAIFGFFILWCISEQFSFLIISSLFRISFDLPLNAASLIYTYKSYGIFIGLLVAWFASRSQKPYYYFYATGILYLLALLCYFLAVTFTNPYLLFIGSLPLGVASGLMLLLIPAIIAGAVKNMEVFIVTCGVMIILKFSYIPQLIGSFIFYKFKLTEHDSIIPLFITIAVPMMIAMLLILPAKCCLFNEAPPSREVEAATPTYRNAIAVFLLFFVPFYCIYWFASLHREIRTFSQSPTLLTPVAAGWCCLLVPLGIPVLLATLNDNMRDISQQKSLTPSYKTGLVIFFSVIMPPISVALVQAQFNQLQQLPQEQE